MQNEGAFV